MGEAVEQFNSTHKHRKRGICLIPQKYGVGIVPMFAQAGALINVHLDGSVNLYVGGVEMGNGFYTKMVQVASNELGIPMSKIHITESGTDKVPNPHMSGASSSSDLSGPAVIKACRELMARLAPVKEANPGATWEQLAGAAWGARINLSVAAHYSQDQAWTGWTGASKEDGFKKEGDRWAYWVTSATAITVEVDVLTGEHRLVSAHVVMDLGEVINPGIDTVQIEGGFLQGYGYLTMESCDIAQDGKLLSVGPNTYTIPSIADIPPVFEVSLLRKDTPEVHQRPLYTSKAVGEQGLYTGCTVYFAIKDAVRAARKERGLTGSFDLLTPTTPANVIDAIYNAKLRVHGLTS